MLLRVDERDRGFVADRAVGSSLVVVSTAVLYLGPCVVKAEAVGVQAFRPELAVEGPDEGVIGRLTWPGEVQDNTLLVGP